MLKLTAHVDPYLQFNPSDYSLCLRAFVAMLFIISLIVHQTPFVVGPCGLG
jgi:hypothetical protein